MKKIIAIVAVCLALLSLSACNAGPNSNAQSRGQKQTEKAFNQQSNAVPYPVDQLRDSAERRNLRERLLRFNKQDRLGYVYIFNFGKVEGYYTIHGKISSTESQMTTPNILDHPCSGCDRYVLEGPQDDGSYSGNEPGIFFFTTEGALIETNLEHLYSDQPIPTYADIPKLNGAGKVQDLTARKN